ncbi:MAG: AAA family ATPase [Christensenellaceae bacterium]
MTKYEELQRESDDALREANVAKEAGDFYTVVTLLRKAAACQLGMSDLVTAPDLKNRLVARSNDYLRMADAWQKLHPESFRGANQNGGRSGDRNSSSASASSVAVQPAGEKTGTTFDDVRGCEDVKAFVRKQYIKRFDPRYSVVFSDGRGGALERGMLLFGPPGTGKTLIARAIATEVHASFIAVQASELKDSLVGETEKHIHALYERAAAEADPLTIVFIDEIESLIPNRNGNVEDYEISAVNEFLQVLDGFHKEKAANVITIGASNFPDRIDPAAIRPGRLGAWFRVDVPNAALRGEFFDRQFASGYTLEAGVRDLLINRTKGYSGADVVAICDRVKSALTDEGIRAVDAGKSEAEVLRVCSVVSKRVAEQVASVSNSSISARSIEELALFEENYNFKCANGDIRSFMAHID